MTSPMEPTPPVDEFLARYRTDDNEWWRIACGHHMNLFEEAVDQRDEARAAIDRVRALTDVWGRCRCSQCRSNIRLIVAALDPEEDRDE